MMENTRKNRARFATALKMLMVNSSVKYASSEEEKLVLKMYFNAISPDVSIEEFEAATTAVIKTWKLGRLPTVREILDWLPGNQYAKVEDRAEIQVAVVLDTLRSKGSKINPDWKDPITGWIMTYRWPYNRWGAIVVESELKWWAKEFKELYRSVASGGQKKMLDYCGGGSDEPKQIGEIIKKTVNERNDKNE